MSDDSGFDAFALSPARRDALRALRWSAPTDVQARGLAPALAGKDLLVCAPTGTGKTGLFGIALLERLASEPPRPGRPKALIVVPTRELAEQTGSVLKSLGGSVATVFGGVPHGPQDMELSHRNLALVGTPGRILDHVRRGAVKLTELKALVLDEADRLLDASFRAEFLALLKLVPERRQTILLSATLPPEMGKLSRQLLREPVRIDAGAIAPQERIREAFFPCAVERKMDLLLALLDRYPAAQTLVFTRTREKADRVGKALEAAGRANARLHAGIAQADRSQAMEDFRAGRAPILVATDVASRGIDIPSLALVINFDVPNTPEDYIHRTGRTGRLDREGIALSIVAPSDLALAAGIEIAVRRRIESIQLGEFQPEPSSPAEHRAQAQRGFWREVERPHDLDERPLHKGKVRSPFNRDGSLSKDLKPEEPEKPRRNARKREVRRVRNKKLPHQK